jgi:hypothetical protein
MVLRSASLLLFLPLLSLPALSGQPAKPKGDGAALAGRPVLTAAELDTLEFSSTFDSTESRARAPGEGVDKLALGVWVSRQKYHEGEPIPVLFAVRNRGPACGLDMRIELTTAEAVAYNGARLRLECTDAGSTWKQRLSHTYVCGGPPLAVIERGGYHCSGGDLRALGGGLLPAGSYRLSWSYRGLRSNLVSFTVLPARDVVAPLSRRPLAGILELVGGKLEGLPDGPREHSMRLSGARAAWSRPHRIAPHLASGVAGKYYPALADLPVLDGGLEATARFVRRGPAALPSAVEVTLRAAHHARELVLDPHALQFALLVEPRPGAKGVGERNGPPNEGDRKGVMKGQKSLALDRPVILRLDLPDRWESHARLEGPARVAVLLGTERWHRRDLREVEEVRVLSRAGGRQAWRGVLRSPWLDVEFPALAEQAPARPSHAR